MTVTRKIQKKKKKNYLTLSQKWRTMAFVDSAIALVCDDGLDYKTRIYNDIVCEYMLKWTKLATIINWYSQ